MQTNSSTKNDYIGGIASIGLGAYCGSKAVTSGIRRALGVRIEEHTTSAEHAKKIIKNNCTLDPKFGGTGASLQKTQFRQNSVGNVHITGVHKNYKDTYVLSEMVEGVAENKFLQAINRKEQRITYRIASIPKNAKSKLEKSKAFFGAKTFFVGGSEEYFNSNFKPDEHELALKTDKCVKVCKTKIGATIEAIKRDGLSGVKQNKTRVAVGIAAAIGLGYLSYKFIKKGLEKFGLIKKTENNKLHNVK